MSVAHRPNRIVRASASSAGPSSQGLPRPDCTVGYNHQASAGCSSWSRGSRLFSQRSRVNGGRSGYARLAKQQMIPCSTNGTSTSAEQRGKVENVVVIGSGPAGYTAAIYTARANLKPVVFEGFQKGGCPGGQLMTTTEVENFPGFPDGITGPDLMDRMRAQAVRWGTEMYTEDVEELDLSQRPFRIRSTEQEVYAHTVIIATGATAKRLHLPNEEKYWSKGISACAICDGASPLFKMQDLAVVGGGDSATEEAVYLTKYGRHVHLLVRGPQMRASKTMQDRVLNNRNITVHFNTQPVDAYGDARDQFLGGLKLEDSITGEIRKLPVKGLFYGIGHTPNSELVAGQVELDNAGYVKVVEGGRTSMEGVYAAGDLHDTEWRQAITAAGSGCQAAIASERYLVANDLVTEYHQAEEAASAAPGAAAGRKAQEGQEELDMEQTKHRGQYALRKLYHESERVIVVLYTAPTCGPCRSLKPILNKVVDEYASQVHYVEIDIVEDPEIAQAGGVVGSPTVQFFKDKEMVENLPGVKMKSEYRRRIESYLGSGAEVKETVQV